MFVFFKLLRFWEERVKKLSLIFLLLLLSITLFAQDWNIWESVRNSSYNSAGQITFRYEAPANNGASVFYYDSGSSSGEVAMQYLNGTTYQAQFNGDAGNDLDYRMRFETNTSVHLMPKKVSDTFPQAIENLSILSEDPIGDMAAGSYNNLDISGDYFAYSNNKLHYIMENFNTSTGFPTNSGGLFPSRYYVYVAEFQFPGDPANETYAMVYVNINIPFVVNLQSGLYKIIGSEISLDSITRLSGIETNVSNSALKMSCNLSNLPSSVWPNSYNALQLKSSTGYITTSQDTYIADQSKQSYLFLYDKTLSPFNNQLPLLANVNYSVSGNNTTISLDYSDANENFPLVAQVELDNGSTFNFTGQSHDFSNSVEYIAYLDQSWQTGLIRFSDNGEDFVEYEIDGRGVSNFEVAVHQAVNGHLTWEYQSSDINFSHFKIFRDGGEIESIYDSGIREYYDNNLSADSYDYNMRVYYAEGTSSYSETESIEILDADENFDTGILATGWTSSGNSPWFFDNANQCQGAYSLSSGDIAHNQISSLSYAVNFTEPGQITFWKKVSSEANYDKLFFYIDDVQQGVWSGEVDWSQESFNVTSGNHILKWSYSKDGSVDSGSDCAWIDYLSYPSTGSTQPSITINPTSIDFGEVFVNYSETDFFTVKNVGYSELTGSMASPTDFTISNNELRGEMSWKEFRSTYSGNRDQRNTLDFAINPGDSLIVAVQFAPTSVMIYNEIMLISSNDPANPSLELQLLGQSFNPPQMATSPESINMDLFVGESATDNFRISNQGGSTLNYNLSIVGQSRNSGGPDLFGYSWIDSDTPGYESLYNWLDISSIGTEIISNGDYDNSASTADDSYKEIALPFDFPFYREVKNSVKISSNGYLTFGENATAYYGSQIPSPDGNVDDIIAPLFADLKPLGLVEGVDWGHVYYYYDQSLERLIVEYNQVARYVGSNPQNFETFQVVLYANGNIVFLYNDMSDQTNCNIGIENATGNDGLSIAYNTDYVQNGLAVEISVRPEWLSLDQSSGSITAMSYQDITITCDSSILAPGNYFRTIEVRGNDPENPEDYIFVTLQVNQASIDTPENLMITVSNGNINLSWSPVDGAAGYSIYSSVDPELPKAEWTHEAIVTNPSWQASTNGHIRFYYITAQSEIED